MLGGSWVVTGSYKCRIDIVIKHMPGRGLLTLRTTTHEPPSKLLGMGHHLRRVLEIRL